MATLPQINNQMSNEIATTNIQLPSKTYKITENVIKSALTLDEPTTTEGNSVTINNLGYDTFSIINIKGYTTQENNTITNVSGTIKIKLANGTDSSASGYTEKVISLVLPTGLELCKIGTNYDTIIKENGVWKIPNKIVKIASYNGETITTDYISSTGGLDTGATVYYIGTTDYTITDANLISKLEELQRMTKTYMPIYISSDTSAILVVEYYTNEDVHFNTIETDRIDGFVDGLDAIKQAIYHILYTERYAYPIYSDNYGIELEQYIGKDLTYIQTTIESTLREALTYDLRIKNVFVNSVENITKDYVRVNFTADTIYGDLVLEVDINV